MNEIQAVILKYGFKRVNDVINKTKNVLTNMNCLEARIKCEESIKKHYHISEDQSKYIIKLFSKLEIDSSNANYYEQVEKDLEKILKDNNITDELEYAGKAYSDFHRKAQEGSSFSSDQSFDKLLNEFTKTPEKYEQFLKVLN